MSRTLAGNLYWQIVRTYLHRKMLWMSGAIFIVILAVLTALALWGHPHQEDTSMLFFSQVWILATLLAQLKEQIASPRAVLVPDYRGPHLVVAGTLAILPLVYIPLGISAAFGLPPLAVLATMTVFAALALWCIYMPKWPWVTAVAVLWCGSFSQDGRHALHAALTNTATLADLLLIGGGLAAIGGLGLRLMRLREEAPEYARQIVNNRWHTMATSGDAQVASQKHYSNPLARLISAPSQRQLARLGASGTSSPWACIKRWQLAGNPPHVVWIFALVVIGQMIFMAFTTGSVDAHGLAFQLVLFPAIILPQWAFITWRTLGIESLRPIRRAAYLRERAWAFGLQVVTMWLMLAMAVLAGAALLSPQSLSSRPFWVTLGATALVQCPIFASSVWFLRYRSYLATALPVIVFGGLGTGGVALCGESRIGMPIPWVAAIVLVTLLLSAIILRDAYRRWLRTDLA